MIWEAVSIKIIVIDVITYFPGFSTVMFPP